MCGVFGAAFKSKQAGKISSADKAAALASLAHRGPDDTGIYEFSQGFLGHTRLSILDLSPAGHQPMCDNGNRTCIAHNGEIYNFPEMRFTLEKQGVVFRSHTDTEVALQAFKQQGVDVFTSFNGMFACAILDRNLNKLFLVRDRFGIKPLYYSISDDRLVFASEIKTIHLLQPDNKKLNKAALHEFLYFGNALGERTLFSGIQKLPPGSYLELDLDSFSIRQHRYWDPAVLPQNTPGGNVVGRTQLLLETAVKRQLVSDVPVGIFLSGGIDSSAITAFATRHAGTRLSTYSVGFDFDKGVNELPKARRIAEFFGTDHHEQIVSGYDLPDIVTELVRCHDQPFSDAANIPLLLLCRQLGVDAKVVLQGDGGDEIFAGYRRYSTLRSRGLWRRMRPLALLANNILPKNAGFFRRRRYINALGAQSDAQAMALLLTVEDKASRPEQIFSQEFQTALAGTDPFDRYEECDRQFENLDIVQRMLYTDTQIILPDIFLEKVDRSTMACSTEVRVPFLDHDLTDYVMSLPSALKVRGGRKKWLLKAALEGIVPNDILSAPKTGFGVPFGYWLKTSLYDFFGDTLAAMRQDRQPIFDYDHVNRLFQQHRAGERNNDFLLWKVLNLALWLRMNGL